MDLGVPLPLETLSVETTTCQKVVACQTSVKLAHLLRRGDVTDKDVGRRRILMTSPRSLEQKFVI